MTIAAAFLGWMFDGMEMGIFPLVARPALQQMQATAGIADEKFVQSWMGIVTALFLLGAAAGGLVFGWLGDRIGRVKAMTWSILAYSIFTGLCYFAAEPWHLATLRFTRPFQPLQVHAQAQLFDGNLLQHGRASRQVLAENSIVIGL